MRRLRFALPFVMTYATACAHRVGQNAHTGPDGDPEGAEVMALARGVARAAGIVTYPGGDRVDWKRVEVGDGPPGTLELDLRWTSARPGGRLAVAVFDAAGNRVARSRTRRSRADHRRVRVEVAPASGRYLIQVFAMDRGDAGDYTLTARFTPGPPPALPMAWYVDIPPLPELPALPAPRIDRINSNPPPCTTYDPANPRCQDSCPTPPDPAIPGCQRTMPCPSPPDRRIRACLTTLPPCPGPGCNPPRPLTARVIDLQIDGSAALVTLDRGSADGIDVRWTGRLVKPPRARCRLLRVSKHSAICRLDANLELERDLRLELLPP